MIDRARSYEGFAGIAIFKNDEQVFIDSIESSFAFDVLFLFKKISEKGFKNMTAIKKGYSTLIYSIDDIMIMIRLSGKRYDIPIVSLIEPDFIGPQQMTGLPPREKAENDAREMLKKLNIQ
jgi:hypothetical protein